MKAVDFLANSWAVKPYRILSEGGAVPLVSTGQSENIWNAFLHSKKEK
jgi:hypothetical protein